MALTVFTDTFVSVAEADSLLVSVSELWADLAPATKAKWLVLATQALNELPYLSSAVAADQPLAWPRAEFEFLDPALNRIVTVPQGQLPSRLARATSNLALHFAQNPSVLDDSIKTYESINVGPIGLFDITPTNGGRVSRVPYANVTKLLEPFLKTGQTGQIPWRAW